MKKKTETVTAKIGHDNSGSSHKATNAISEPTVPGATGKKPLPAVVAMAMARVEFVFR